MIQRLAWASELAACICLACCARGHTFASLPTHHPPTYPPVHAGSRAGASGAGAVCFAVHLHQPPPPPSPPLFPAQDRALARQVQALFASPAMRVNITDDVVGVEICGALKNVLAIAAGIVEGLELGHNAMAALISQVGSCVAVWALWG